MSKDAVYLRNVRALMCIVGVPGVHCYGRTHAHHAGERPGMSRKAPDDTAVPLCLKHHEEWHNASGYFRHLDKDGRREWAEKAIAETRERLAPF